MNTNNSLKIRERIHWWNNNYTHISDKEGWCVATPFDFFRATWIKTPMLMLKNKAQKWGWIFDEYYNVLDFNEDIFNKNKHILIANELGLL